MLARQGFLAFRTLSPINLCGTYYILHFLKYWLLLQLQLKAIDSLQQKMALQNFSPRDYTWSSRGRAVLGSVGRPLVVDRSTRDRTSRPSLLFCLPKPRSGLTGKATGSVILSSILTCSWLFVSSLLVSNCLLPLTLSLLLSLSLSLKLPLSLSSSSSSVSKGASPLGPGMAADISSLKEHKWLKHGFIYVFLYEKASKFIKAK